MSRYKAFAIHLGLSAIAVGTIMTIVFFVWYPAPTAYIAGAGSIALMLVGVDLLVGPTLTLIVFRSGKPGLKFDLTVIVAVQLCAMIYGATTLYRERPAYLVFAVDRFNMVAARHVDQAVLDQGVLGSRVFGGIATVFARRPEDPEEHQRYMDSIFTDGRPDIEERPEYWEPYESGKQEIIAATRPLDDLPADTPRDRARIEQAISKYQAEHPRLGFVPVVSGTEDIGMLMDMDTAEPIDVIRVNPWLAEPLDRNAAVGSELASAVDGE